MKRSLSLIFTSALFFGACTVSCGKSDVTCTKVTVSSGMSSREVTLTDEMNQKLTDFYSETNIKKEVEVDLAVLEVVQVCFSDGVKISADHNGTEYVSCDNGKKKYIISVDKEFKDYIISLENAE